MARVRNAIAVLGLAVAAGLGWYSHTAGGAQGDEPGDRAEPAEADALQSEFVEAGVCARCHVNVVLEWGISVHYEEEKNCQDCHGRSKAHVENERNEVKPDRIPRGEQIAGLCARCHEEGCPETERQTGQGAEENAAAKSGEDRFSGCTWPSKAQAQSLKP